MGQLITVDAHGIVTKIEHDGVVNDVPPYVPYKNREFSYKGVTRSQFNGWDEEDRKKFLAYIAEQFYNLPISALIKEFMFTPTEGRKVESICKNIKGFVSRKGAISLDEKQAIRNLQDSKIINTEYSIFTTKRISKKEFLKYDEEKKINYIKWLLHDYKDLPINQIVLMMNDNKPNRTLYGVLSKVYKAAGGKIVGGRIGKELVSTINKFRSDFGMDPVEYNYCKKKSASAIIEPEVISEPEEQKETTIDHKIIISSITLSGMAEDIIEKMIDEFSEGRIEVTIKRL